MTDDELAVRLRRHYADEARTAPSPTRLAAAVRAGRLRRGRRAPANRMLAVAASVVFVLAVAAGLALGLSGSRAGHRAATAGSHGDLTDRQYTLALAAAHRQAERDKPAGTRDDATGWPTTLTAATAWATAGTITAGNTGTSCSSGTVIQLHLFGSFGTATGGSDGPVTAEDFVVDGVSGVPCLITVRAGPTAPEQDVVILFRR